MRTACRGRSPAMMYSIVSWCMKRRPSPRLLSRRSVAASLRVIACAGLFGGCAGAQDRKASGATTPPQLEDFDAGSFSRPLQIDNAWLPLKPGTRFVYDGTTIEEDARAGIMMKAKPQLGTPSYAEGWAPAVEWTDRGQVDQMGQKVCVPVRCFEDVLVIAETSTGEPGAQQLKYYAHGVGNVRVGW